MLTTPETPPGEDPSVVTNILERCDLLRDLPQEARATAIAAVRTTTLLAGEVLLRRGSRGRDAYIVLSGTLEVLDEEENPVAVIQVGELIGERALLNGGSRNATVRAARDTEVGRLPAAVVDRLLDEFPLAARRLAGMLAERTTFNGRTAQRTCQTVAIVPLGGAPIVKRLERAAADHGPVIVIDAARINREVGAGAAAAVPGTALASRVNAWLDRVEAAHATVLLVGGGRRWTARCLRGADEAIAVVGAERASLPPRFSGRVVISRAGGRPSHDASSWFDEVPPSRVHHVDASSSTDVSRLTRALRGQSFGLVLGGGGARGLAHLGVLRALETCGITVDAIGGTSIGALAGATFAMGWDHDERLSRSVSNLVETRRLLGWTLPLASLTSATKLTRILRSDAFFGETNIEDLALPFFALSASFTTGDAVIHDRGPLWLAARASTSLPGIMPPVPIDGDLLVDGGVVNNVPVDVMRERLPGRTIAVNLRARVAEPVATSSFGPSLSGWRILASRMMKRHEPIRLPGPATMMLRAKELGSKGAHDDRLALADLLIEPPVDGVDNLDFRAALPLVDRAYAHTCDQLETWLATADAQAVA